MRAALGTLLLAALAADAGAQTNDHFFRSWRWVREEESARAAGLGGAVAALADDAGAMRSNPAVLTSLSRVEIGAHFVRRGNAETTGGDHLAGGGALGSFTIGAPLGPRWAIGAYASDIQGVRTRLEPRALPDGLTDEGEIDVHVRDAGVAGAWRAASGLTLGLRLAVVHVSADGDYRRERSGEPTHLRVETAGGDARLGWSVAAAWEPSARLRLACLAEAGTALVVERTAASPWLGATLDAGSTYRMRVPGVVSCGTAIRVSRKVLGLVQIDRVRYGEIQSVVIIRQGAESRDDYRLEDAWEPRLGLEVSVPLHRVSLQFRAGAHGLAPGGLSYEGRDATEEASFLGSARSLAWSGGAAVVTGGFRLDAAVRGGPRPAWLLGATVRF